MRTFVFTAEQHLLPPPPEVFPFFADAHNLEAITPPWLAFEVLTPPPIAIARGTLIDYRLRWRGIPLRWRTEITAWQPPHRFVDEQVRGPYRLWRHEHRFVADAGGTLMTDRVEYAVPGGALVNRMVVARDVERIFAHRRRVLSGNPSLSRAQSPLEGAVVGLAGAEHRQLGHLHHPVDGVQR